MKTHTVYHCVGPLVLSVRQSAGVVVAFVNPRPLLFVVFFFFFFLPIIQRANGGYDSNRQPPTVRVVVVVVVFDYIVFPFFFSYYLG